MGIIIAALTTAVAFYAMALTGTKAFAEFGFVLGTGIIICLIIMILVLPALYAAISAKKNPENKKSQNFNTPFCL